MYSIAKFFILTLLRKIYIIIILFLLSFVAVYLIDANRNQFEKSVTSGTTTIYPIDIKNAFNMNYPNLMTYLNELHILTAIIANHTTPEEISNLTSVILDTKNNIGDEYYLDVLNYNLQKEAKKISSYNLSTKDFNILINMPKYRPNGPINNFNANIVIKINTEKKIIEEFYKKFIETSMKNSIKDLYGNYSTLIDNKIGTVQILSNIIERSDLNKDKIYQRFSFLQNEFENYKNSTPNLDVSNYLDDRILFSKEIITIPDFNYMLLMFIIISVILYILFLIIYVSIYTKEKKYF